MLRDTFFVRSQLIYFLMLRALPYPARAATLMGPKSSARRDKRSEPTPSVSARLFVQ
jgi:hypothetical protein